MNTLCFFFNNPTRLFTLLSPALVTSIAAPANDTYLQTAQRELT